MWGGGKSRFLDLSQGVLIQALRGGAQELHVQPAPQLTLGENRVRPRLPPFEETHSHLRNTCLIRNTVPFS